TERAADQWRSNKTFTPSSKPPTNTWPKMQRELRDISIWSLLMACGQPGHCSSSKAIPRCTCSIISGYSGYSGQTTSEVPKASRSRCMLFLSPFQWFAWVRSECCTPHRWLEHQPPADQLECFPLRLP